MRQDNCSEANILKNAAILQQQASARLYAQIRTGCLTWESPASSDIAASFAATGRAILFRLIEIKQ